MTVSPNIPSWCSPRFPCFFGVYIIFSLHFSSVCVALDESTRFLMYFLCLSSVSFVELARLGTRYGHKPDITWISRQRHDFEHLRDSAATPNFNIALTQGLEKGFVRMPKTLHDPQGYNIEVQGLRGSGERDMESVRCCRSCRSLGINSMNVISK